MLGPLVRFPLRVLGSIRARRYEYNYRRRIDDLIDRGLTIGKNVIIDPEAYIDYNYPFLITIGDNSVICAGVCILAHDATILRWTGGMARLREGHTRVGRVVIKENCILSVNSVVLPGVTIGPNVLVGAGSVVTKDIPPNSCVAGVPARFYDHWDKLMGQHESQIKSRPVFDAADLEGDAREAVKQRLKEAVREGDAYLRGYVGRYPYIINEVED